ncbi:MAG: hypothetical protein J6A16_03010, partial [Oscillospiraceae bacterium]|nr:hypothetical protein [Oscillospiraceae bacterium]
MRSIVKANTYRLIDNHSFELPLPFRFELLKKNCPIAGYEISENEDVSYTILTKFKEDMLTTIQRPLTAADIFFFLSCRVFQDRTPYTYQMLKNVGLEKYDVLEILHRTHGIIPYDNYWIKFEGEELTYEEASESFDKMMQPPLQPESGSAMQASGTAAVSPSLNEILSQHTIDVSGIVARNGSQSPADPEMALRQAVAFSIPEAQEEELVNNKMSENEIEALLMKAGIGESPAPAATSAPGDGGMMSEDAIAALLAANAAPEPEPAPVEEAPASSGGMMSEDAIAALLAANAAPEPEPAPVEEAPASSGGMMSEE